MYIVSIFGSKAIFLPLLPCKSKTLYFASPDYSGFAIVVMFFIHSLQADIIESYVFI